MDLARHNYWIFDMDGTLTLAMHDFDAIRANLGLPPGRPILEALAALPAEEADLLKRRLDELEWELACRASPQPGARELLLRLHRRGARLGILTRNNRRNACETLRRCDLANFFEPDCILGRESAAPKPDPEGIHKLLAYWGADPQETVTVGDYLFDLQAGRQAGTATVYVDITGDGRWTEQADIRVRDLGELLALSAG